MHSNIFLGMLVEWEPHDSMPCCSIRTLLTWFFDITTPLLPIQLENLSAQATETEEQQRLIHLASVSENFLLYFQYMYFVHTSRNGDFYRKYYNLVFVKKIRDLFRLQI